MSGLEIVTMGGGELMARFFNAVVMVVGSSAFQSLILITIFCGLVTCFWMLATHQFEIKAAIMWFGKVMLISNLLLAPKTTVIIHDSVAKASMLDFPMATVDNVPVSLALLAQLTSQMGYGLTKVMETAFSLPSNEQVSETGLLFAARLVNSASNISIESTELAGNLNQLVQQCVVPEVMHGRLTMREVSESTNLWSLFKNRGNRARRFLYQQGTTKSLKSCADPDVLNQLDAAMKVEHEHATSRLTALFGLPHKDLTHDYQKSVILSRLPAAFDVITGSSNATGAGPSATDIIEQGIMRDVLQEAFLSYGAAIDAPAMVESFMHIKADIQNAYHAAESAHSAMQYLPLVQMLLTVILIGMFPIVVLLMFMPGFGSIGKKYIGLFVWLQLWAPISALVQLCVYHNLQRAGAEALMHHGGHLTLQTLSTLHSAASDSVTVARNLMMAVPAISGFLVFGSSYMITQALSAGLGGVPGIGSQVASEAATGNITLGNTQLDTVASHTASSHHFDDNLSVMNGSAALQSASGSLHNYSAGGGFSIQSGSAVSQVPQHVHLSNAVRGSFESGLQHSTQLAESAMQTYTDAQSSVYQDLMDLGSHYGSTQNMDGTTTVGNTYSDTNSMTRLHELNKQFSEEHHISDRQSSTILGAVSAKLSGSKNFGSAFGFGGSANIGIDNHSISSHDKIFQAAENFAKREHLTDALENAKRAVIEDHFRVSDDRGTHLAENIHANFERSEHASQQVTANLEQAKRYQSGIQLSRDHAENVDSDLSTQYVEWLAQQPDPLSNVPLGAARADHLIHHQPDLASAYAQEFVKSLPSDALLQQVGSSIESAGSTLATEYQAATATLPSVTDVKEAHLENVDTILGDTRAQHVLVPNVQNTLESRVADVKENVDAGIDGGQQLKNETRVAHKAKREIDHHRGHLTQVAARESLKSARSTLPWVDPYKKEKLQGKNDEK